MKGLFAIILALPLWMSAHGAEKVVPFESVRLSVDVNDSWDRIFNMRGTHFGVKLHFTSQGQEQRPTCSISIYCRSLREDGDLSMDDVKALAEVAAAAEAKKALKREVSYTSHLPSLNAQSKSDPLKTTFESVHKNKQKNEWIVTIKRIGAPLEVTIEEVNYLQILANQANSGSLWYETLFSAPAPPKPSITSSPPSGSFEYFEGLVGGVQNGNHGYYTYVQASPRHDKPCHVAHGYGLPTAQGNSDWLFGEWVRGMMVHVTHAAAAAHKMESYSFVGREGSLRYAVSADPSAKTAKLRIHPNFGNSDLTFHDVDYSLDDARAIADLINHTDEAEKWFKDNQGLFVTPVAP